MRSRNRLRNDRRFIVNRDDDRKTGTSLAIGCHARMTDIQETLARQGWITDGKCPGRIGLLQITQGLVAAPGGGEAWALVASTASKFLRASA